MMKNLLWFFRKNRIWRSILLGAALLLYAGLFCLFAYSEMPMLVAKNINDRLMLQGISRDRAVAVVAVTREDAERLGISESVLAAKAAAVLDDVSAVTGFELSAGQMDAEGLEILKGIRNREKLVLPAELSVSETAVIRAPFATDLPENSPVRTYPQDFAGTVSAHTVHLTGEDGILRHMTLELSADDGNTYPSMAQACLECYCSRKGLSAMIPEKNRDSVIIKYSEQEETNYTCTAGELVSGTYPVWMLQERIVYIGFYDTAEDRGYRTGIDHSRRMHTAQVDAEITNCLLSGNVAVSVPILWQYILLIPCILATAAVMLSCRTLAGGICFCAIYALLGQIIAILLFGAGYGVLSFQHLANCLLTGLLFTAVASFKRSRHSREELEKVLGKYVDTRVAGFLTKKSAGGPRSSGPGRGETKKIAVLFADIRSFTTITEKLSEGQLVRMLNDYLSMMSSCCERYSGTVDKFIGDAVMAYWGAPEEDDDPVYHACLAASEIQRRAEEALAKMKDHTDREIRIGIGISYGDAVVGNIGSADHMNFTVIGDTVNTASRLEGLAPGGAVYLSEAAAEKLGSIGELEKLPEEVKLKGKEKTVSVYSMKGVSVRSGSRRKKEDTAEKLQARSRAYIATVVNFAAFFIQFVFVFNTLRSLGIGFISWLPVLLSAFSCAVSVTLIPYDLKAAEQADGKNVRPRRVDNLQLSGLLAGLQCMIMTLTVRIPGIQLGIFGSFGWPGGIAVYLLCPLLSCISFFLLENRSSYSLRDCFWVELPLLLLTLGGGGISVFLMLDLKQPSLYDAFYRFPVPLAYAALDMALGLFAVRLNGKLCLQERLKIAKDFGIGNLLQRLTRSKAAKLLSTERNRQIAGIFVNLLVGILNIRVTFTAIAAGGIRVYSNPSLIGIIVTVCCILSIAILAGGLRHGEPTNRSEVYRYLSFMKQLGCAVDFFSVFLVALTGEGLSAFVTPRWCADWTVFLLCPAIVLADWLSEKNEYRIWKCLLTALPFAGILLLSRTAILTRNMADRYDYEILNFYNSNAVIAIIAAEFAAAGIFYVLNLFVGRMIREAERKNRQFTLCICGSRYGITGGKKTESLFGIRSECYCLRDGDYGIIVGAGSGLQEAKAVLAGCQSVDILVGTADFRYMMGFLMTPDVCPGAKLRVLTPFGAERFSVAPFWPVNLIRKFCVTVPAEKSFRLNDMYSVLFTRTDEAGRSFRIRVEGEPAVICCTGPEAGPEESLRQWCADADLLIVDDPEIWNRGCYIAIDNGIPGLLLTGAPMSMDDESLSLKEQELRRLYADAAVARDGDVIPIHRG